MAGSLVYSLAPVVLETRDTEEHAGAGDDYLNKTPFSPPLFSLAIGG